MWLTGHQERKKNYWRELTREESTASELERKRHSGFPGQVQYMFNAQYFGLLSQKTISTEQTDYLKY